ncbi:MAG: DUF2971 domain-containing protein [Bacteroidota bacterium]
MILRNTDLVALAIKRGQFPQYVYRYRPLNDKTYDELSEGYLWFSNVYSYNDPFEGILKFDTDSSEEELINYIKNADHGKEFSANQIQNFVHQWKKNPDELNSSLNKIKKDLYTKTGICSLTTQPTNILMWSHYADKHTGVCIKYDLEKLISPGITPIKVDYTNEYPKFNYIKEWKDTLKLGLESFQKKSTDWTYEQEYRLVAINGCGKYGLKRNSILEVIGGSKCDTESIEKIKKSISLNLYQHPIIKRASLMENKFGIQID